MDSFPPWVVGLSNAIIKQAVAENAAAVHLEIDGQGTSMHFVIGGLASNRDAASAEQLAFVFSRYKLLAHIGRDGRRGVYHGTFSMKLTDRRFDLRVRNTETPSGECLILEIKEWSSNA